MEGEKKVGKKVCKESCANNPNASVEEARRGVFQMCVLWLVASLRSASQSSELVCSKKKLCLRWDSCVAAEPERLVRLTAQPARKQPGHPPVVQFVSA